MIKGIDISKWQGTVDYTKLLGTIDFVIARSSYGTGFKDEQFERNKSELRRLNIPHGFYHYAYPNLNTPEAEADWFLQSVGELQDGELLVLDFEESYGGNSVDWCKRFLDRVSSRLNNYKPLLYINLNYNNLFDWSSVVNANYGLWLAYWDYNGDNAAPKTDWQITAIEQYSNKGSFAGIIGAVDADVFHGDLTAFKAYGYHAPQSQPPVETISLEQYKADIASKNAEIDKINQALEAANSQIGTLNNQLLNEQTNRLSDTTKLNSIINQKNEDLKTAQKRQETMQDDMDIIQKQLEELQKRTAKYIYFIDTCKAIFISIINFTKRR